MSVSRDDFEKFNKKLYSQALNAVWAGFFPPMNTASKSATKMDQSENDK